MCGSIATQSPKVMWREPIDAGDEAARYTLVELNGDRCLIRFICDLPIAPVTLARTDELVRCES